MDRESLLWWLALEVATLGLFHLCLRPTFFRLFQRQCEYKLQLFVVLSVCLIMIAITKRVSAWYVIL